MLHEIRNESFEKLKRSRVYPDFHAGDSIELQVICRTVCSMLLMLQFYEDIALPYGREC